MLDKTTARALENAKAVLKKRWGNETFVTSFANKVNAISTGSLKLDHLLNIGGYPEGRIIEIYGLESSGKSSLCTIACGNAQKKYPDKIVAYIDLEHALDPMYASKLGFDIVDQETGAIDDNKVLFCQPSGGIEALDIAISLAKSGACSLIVIDSVGGLLTDNELKGETGDQFMGEKARMMSQELPKLVAACEETGTSCIFVNQIRNKIAPYGNPNTTMGGHALRFWASLRLEIKQADIIKQGDAAVGQIVRVTVKKSKVSPPFGVTDINLYFGKGIDQESELADIALAKNIVTQKGAWYLIDAGTDTEQRFHGKNALMQYIEANEDFKQYLKSVLSGDIVTPQLEAVE